jgi:hypothetical protein
MMEPSMRRLVVLAAFASALVGCGADVKVYMALDEQGDRKRSTFYTDTEDIICVAEVPAPRDGITVSATIRQTRTVDEKGVDVLVGIGESVPQKQVAGTGVPKVSFALVRAGANGNTLTDEEPWPPGTFECDIAVDGIQKGTASFDILIPKCPLYPAAQGIRCAGFYPVDGDPCPAADQSVLCTCKETGWDCGGH